MSISDYAVVVGSFTGAASACGIAGALIWRRFRGLGHLLDDLLGEPGRPGVPPRPGVMARLAAHDAALETLARQVAALTVVTTEDIRDRKTP